MPEYMWLEEVDLIDNYSMTYILNSSMENWFVITNTLVNAEPPRLMMRFNAALTNTFVE